MFLVYFRLLFAKTKMNTESRINKAKELFEGSYNCSQSVAAAFADVLGKEEEEIFRLMSGFGFGMGGERSVCGAVSGGIFVISSTVKDPAQREELYDKVFYFISRFKKLNHGNLNCHDLVGKEPTDDQFKTVCPVLLEQVIRIVDEMLGE
jgi:C_GCAxxG_C_C family probable redox protein